MPARGTPGCPARQPNAPKGHSEVLTPAHVTWAPSRSDCVALIPTQQRVTPSTGDDHQMVIESPHPASLSHQLLAPSPAPTRDSTPWGGQREKPASAAGLLRATHPRAAPVDPGSPPGSSGLISLPAGGDPALTGDAAHGGHAGGGQGWPRAPILSWAFPPRPLTTPHTALPILDSEPRYRGSNSGVS